MARKFYAVARGRKPGIYLTWSECQAMVSGFPKASYKSFSSRAAAEAWLNGASPEGPTPSKKKPAVPAKRPGEVFVYTDGGSRNHGNVKGQHVKADDKAAWAYLIILPDGQHVSDTGGEYGSTNNRMEIMALVAALTRLLELGQKDAPITLVLDSRYVLNAIEKGWLQSWQRRGWRKSDGTPVLNQPLWEIVSQILPQFTHLQWSWTKGHANNGGNVFVDQLLNKTMDQMASY